MSDKVIVSKSEIERLLHQDVSDIKADLRSLLDQATPVSGEAVGEIELCSQYGDEISLYDGAGTLATGTKLYTTPQPAILEGYVLVPIEPTMDMLRVMQEEDWEWRDVLASCNAITEHDYLNHEAMIAEAMNNVPQPTDTVPVERFNKLLEACELLEEASSYNYATPTFNRLINKAWALKAEAMKGE